MNDTRALFGQLIPQTIKLIQTEYPNGIRLTLSSPSDETITPKGIYPAFYGCYDWHSAVHSHWQIVKAIRQFPEAEFVPAGKAALSQSLTADHIAKEMEWVAERPNFEMPYGMAWLLTLYAELKDWRSAEAVIWADALQPMAQHAIEAFTRYCEKMPLPNRGGLHNQSAFSLALVWDAARILGDDHLKSLVELASRRFFLADTEINLSYEPSAADFLSPSLSEADLMRRVLGNEEFETWLNRFVPQGFRHLRPVQVVDPSNGQLAHWAGLNFSRGWMLHAIARALPENHPLIPQLNQNGSDHIQAGLPLATHPDYMISHWVPTFAVYALTR